MGSGRRENLASTWKKRPYSFPVCGSSNTHAQSPIGATVMRFCLKLPQGPYYMSANSKGSGTGSPESLLVAYVISTFLMCWLNCWRTSGFPSKKKYYWFSVKLLGKKHLQHQQLQDLYHVFIDFKKTFTWLSGVLRIIQKLFCLDGQWVWWFDSSGTAVSINSLGV